ncbi:hypothetical protein J6R97_05180 [bacterium]|nr:hypothetical protein [bacterium]
MGFNFNKKNIVGVSITPERGLEIAQIDNSTKTIVKYGNKQIAYDNMRQEIADRDIFKDTLQELLFELQIPKGTELVINLPTVSFGIADYPASLNQNQILMAIEEELLSKPIFQDNEPGISMAQLPNSTMQFVKVAYTASQRTLLEELALQIKDLGYKVRAINTSVSSIMNALIYNERVDTTDDNTWTLLLIENSYCRVISMSGNNYLEYFEERISIGEVLGDAENYDIVLNAINPILMNLPSKYLYVVSKTDLISAKNLSEKLSYNTQIIHQDANIFTNSPFLEVSPEIDEQLAKTISLDVIGVGVYNDISTQSIISFNLFNEMLGTIYTSEQPYSLQIGSKTIVLSVENVLGFLFKLSIPIIVVILAVFLWLNSDINTKTDKIQIIEKEIKRIEAYLKQNSEVTSEQFNEADEIKFGLIHNKNIYSYYTIVGTEIPKKVWLTNLELGKYITIEGQADNLESIYSFFRNIKDYNPNMNIKLQKLGLANNTSKLKPLADEEAFDTDSIITSMNADFYEFKISNAPESIKKENGNSANTNSGQKKNSKKKVPNLPPLE